VPQTGVLKSQLEFLSSYLAIGMDDLTLLRFFVAGDVCLEANKNLRVEPINHNQRQLFTRDGALLATAHDRALPPYIMLRLGTKYTPILHQALLDHHLVPVTGALPGAVLATSIIPYPMVLSAVLNPLEISGNAGGKIKSDLPNPRQTNRFAFWLRGNGVP